MWMMLMGIQWVCHHRQDEITSNKWGIILAIFTFAMRKTIPSGMARDAEASEIYAAMLRHLGEVVHLLRTNLSWIYVGLKHIYLNIRHLDIIYIYSIVSRYGIFCYILHIQRIWSISTTFCISEIWGHQEILQNRIACFRRVIVPWCGCQWYQGSSCTFCVYTWYCCINFFLQEFLAGNDQDCLNHVNLQTQIIRCFQKSPWQISVACSKHLSANDLQVRNPNPWLVDFVLPKHESLLKVLIFDTSTFTLSQNFESRARSK